MNRGIFIQKANGIEYQTVEVDIKGHQFNLDKMFYGYRFNKKVVDYFDIASEMKQLIQKEGSQKYKYYKDLIIDVVF